MIKKVSTLIFALLMVLVLITPALADGGVTGSVEVTNAAPTIATVTLQQNDKITAATSMDPLTSYVVEIAAGDINTIDDIETIEIYIYNDVDGGVNGIFTGAFDPDDRAIYKWTKSGADGVWTIEPGTVTVTSWTITEASSDTPGAGDFGLTTGEWNLVFTPGKMAVEAIGGAGAYSCWNVYVKVTDVTGAFAEQTLYSTAMTAYSEISMSLGTMNFGTLALGGTAAIQDAGNVINTVVIANDAHALGIMSAGTWTVGADTITLDESGIPNAPGEFGLVIDDAATLGIPTTLQAVTGANATILGHTVDARTATTGGNEGTTNVPLYMSLQLFTSGIDIGLYTGTITFSVTNG